MSRLYNHRQKKITTKSLILIILIPILGFYIFRGGFDLLINSAVFINNTFGKKTTKSQTAVKKDEFFGSISLDPLPEATNSATIHFSGQSNGFDIGEIYLNDELLAEKVLPSDDTFLYEIPDLKEGENTISFTARTKDKKHQKESAEYIVVYLKNPPTLTIESPTDGQKFDKPNVEIKGSSDKNTDIKFGNLPVLSDSNGNFSGKVTLKNGENNIEISSKDIAGNSTTMTLKLIYEPDN